uniref:Uncharacterized protein n=1 Tax=Tanacetum cinerariifolium TaxID=118510 RepID=A0A699QQW1_TANCI|nr:hypothetical protein [Tanacetum cinerariifolium]
MIDRKDLTLTLDDFRTIFQLPQATDNNHDHFIHAPTFSEMVPFYINNLGFTLELRSTSNFRTTRLLQPWQTLCKMFSRCLTTRVIGYDQPSVQIISSASSFVRIEVGGVSRVDHLGGIRSLMTVDFHGALNSPSETTRLVVLEALVVLCVPW